MKLQNRNLYGYLLIFLEQYSKKCYNVITLNCKLSQEESFNCEV